MHTKSISILAMAMCIGMLFMIPGCNSSSPAVSPIELPEGNCTGMVSNAEGAPVQGASVYLVPEDYSPLPSENGNNEIDSTISDIDGRFGFTVAKNGRFNLLTNRDGQYGIHKSIPISVNTRIELNNETLLDPGSLCGTVQLQSMEDHRSAVILLPGTNKYVTVSDAAGHFNVPALAPGTYHIRFLSMKSDFAPVETTVTITSGAESVCAPVTLQKKSQPQIDSFSVEYDPLMMTATLSWKADDTVPIDSFVIYCNREKNIIPVLTTDNTVSTVTLDIVLSPIDTFVYQIAAVGKDGWEGEPVAGLPFVKKSAIVMTAYPIPTDADDVLYHALFFNKLYVNNGNMYSHDWASREYTIAYIDTGLTIRNTFSLTGRTVNPECAIRFDGNGNLYLFAEEIDTGVSHSILVFDAHLNQVRRMELAFAEGTCTNSFAVSSNGAILLYTAYKTFITPDSLDTTKVIFTDVDTTRIRIYDPSFNLVSESGCPGRLRITEAVNNNGTVAALLYRNTARSLEDARTREDTMTILGTRNDWNFEQLVYFDADFTIVKTVNDFISLDKHSPATYPFSVNSLHLCTGNIFTGIYDNTADNRIDVVLCFADQNGNVVARMPCIDYNWRDIAFDPVNGSFYLQCGMSCTHNNVLLKFSMDERYGTLR